MINIQFETNNAAFEVGKWDMTAEVLRRLADKIHDGGGGVDADKSPIFDINGNRIGLIWESE